MIKKLIWIRIQCMSIQMNRPYGPYGVSLLDDLHTYYPAVLYEPTRFTSVASILQYIQEQNTYHFNIFSRNQENYISSNLNHPPITTPIRLPPQSPPPIQRRPLEAQSPQQTQFITETFDLTPFLYPTYNLPPQRQMRDNLLGTSLLTELLNLFQTPQRGTAATNLDPVLVRPSLETIEAATSLRAATVSDEEEIHTCSICQEGYTEGQAIRTITHCHHAFHNTCIDPWFQRNVRCPVCRYDIREYSTQETP